MKIKAKLEQVKFVAWLNSLSRGWQLLIVVVTCAIGALSLTHHEIAGAVGYAVIVVVLVIGCRRWKGGTALVLAACLIGQESAAQVAALQPSRIPVTTTNSPPLPQEPEPNQPEVVGCLVAAVVLIVGAVVVVKLVQFCKSHYPPPPIQATNSVPPLTNSVPTNEITAFYTPSVALVTGPQQFTISCAISPDGSITLDGSYFDSDAAGLSYSAWTNVAESVWGLDLRAGTQFTVNGQQVQSIPYNITVTNGSISVTEDGVPSRTIVVDRSSDLRLWRPVVTNTWSTTFTTCYTVDTHAPKGGAFYRARIVSPPE